MVSYQFWSGVGSLLVEVPLLVALVTSRYFCSEPDMFVINEEDDP